MSKDLIILVADKDIKFALTGILQRHHALNIKKIDYDIFIHPLHDPGVYKQAVPFLRPYINQYEYALVLLDKEGSGQENKTSFKIENEIKKQLEINGWDERADVIVFEPELEIWVWINSDCMAKVIGWNDFYNLKSYIIKNGLWQREKPKPDRPKKAFNLALKHVKIPRSSSLFKEIADNVDFGGCTERSFLSVRKILQKWFK